MADFARNVFVNCPFDEAYKGLLRPILFVILDLGLTPRIALESLNSGRARIEKIVRLIEESRYAIHDLSRLQASEVGEYYRLNMPLELGIDIGCQLFGSGGLREKRCLILETKPYRYQAAISDLSNSDIAVHGDEPDRAAIAVCDWLKAEAELKAPGASHLWNRFNDFMAWNYVRLAERHYSDDDIKRQGVPDLLEAMREWIAEQPLEMARRT